VALFLKLDEGVRYIFQLNIRGGLPGAAERLEVILTDAFHFSVVERSGEDTALALHAPIPDRLIDQKMEQRVIRS